MPEINLNPGGPHSPERTREAGRTLAEAVRVLNYATRRGEDGLEHPSDVYDVTGWLNAAAQRMPQLLAQLAAFLEAKRADPWLADSRAGVPGHAATAREAAGEGVERLAAAEEHIWAFAAEVAAAQNAIAGLYMKDGSGD